MGFYAFVSLALLTVVMAWATWDEHVRGSTVVYNSMWFNLLWILMATLGCYYILESSLHKRLPVFLLHIAFLLMGFTFHDRTLTSYNIMFFYRHNYTKNFSALFSA